MRRCVRVLGAAKSVALTASLKSLVSPKGLFASVLLLSATHLSASEAYGQSCRPAVLKYIVRDERGENLSEAEMQAVRKQMAQPAAEVSMVSLSEDGGVYSDYSTEAKEAKTKLPALSYADAKSCELNVKELTLQHEGKTMRLIFNMNIYRRAFVIDSLPFQRGTFELDLNDISEEDSSRVIPAKRWKKISDNP
jgi:hypothetical protein